MKDWSKIGIVDPVQTPEKRNSETVVDKCGCNAVAIELPPHFAAAIGAEVVFPDPYGLAAEKVFPLSPPTAS